MADKTLLDRLNALKPSGIALGGQHTESPRASDTATPAPATATREDALSARLRTLRRGQDAQESTTRAKAVPGETKTTSLSTTSGGSATDDDQALDDLLLALAAADLGDEDVDEDVDDGDECLRPLPDVPQGLDEDGGDEDEDEEDTEKKVAELLRDLGAPEARPPGGATVAGGHADDDDDSDGETMRRDVKEVLEQAQTEAALDTGESLHTPEPANTDDAVLALPAVPTELVADDDDAISARLAALRGLHGKAAGLGETDAFGLPSAPTFQPGQATKEAAKSNNSWRGRAGAGGRYSDADEQTWCVVCFGDADVRCLGCSDSVNDDATNNAYCHRCWRAMHVGPAAGYDERGHARVPLRRT